MQTWNTLDLLKASEPHMPHYVTDLNRESFLQIPAIAEAVRTGMEQDGSNTGFYYVDQLGWEQPAKRLFGKTPAVLKLGAKQAEVVGKLLAGRILKGKTLYIFGSDIQVAFEPGERAEFVEGEKEVRIKLDEVSAAEISRKLQPKEGQVALTSFKGLTIKVVKTYIKDQEGNVVSTIG